MLRGNDAGGGKPRLQLGTFRGSWTCTGAGVVGVGWRFWVNDDAAARLRAYRKWSAIVDLRRGVRAVVFE